MVATPPRRREKTSAAPKRIVPLGETHLHWALVGWRRFGKGQHRAALKFGDCLGYGLAMALQAPLLFKGADFAATDVQPALAPTTGHPGSIDAH
jgi:ribonuclease VapC